MATVFLDRDDTLIACTDLPAPPPPAAPGDLVDPAGHTLVVVSNQGSVARGGASIAVVESVNRRLDRLLSDDAGRALVASYYFCPFHPKGNVPEFTCEHPWRKPGGGMVHAAAKDLGLSLTGAWMIGDAPRDIEAGLAAGLDPMRCLLVGAALSFTQAAERILAP